MTAIQEKVTSYQLVPLFYHSVHGNANPFLKEANKCTEMYQIMAGPEGNFGHWCHERITVTRVVND